MIIDGITTPSGTIIDVGELDSLDSSVAKGVILQVLQTVVNVGVSTTIASDTLTEIPAVTINITPTSVNSKILVKVFWTGELSHLIAPYNTVFGLNRNGSPVGHPAAAGSRIIGLSVPSLSYEGVDAGSTMESSSFEYIDSPSTISAITYTLNVTSAYSQTVFTSRTLTDNDTNEYERTISTITVMEIAA